MAQLSNAHSPIRLSFEFFPPSEAHQQTYWRNVGQLETLTPDFFSVTQGALGADRKKSLDTVLQLQAESPVPVAAHLTGSADAQDAVDALADDLFNHGIRHIVALRGDAPAERGGYPDGLSLVEALQRRHPFEISVAAYPETHPKAQSDAADLQVLKHKFEAGATRALTQFFFDAETFLRFRDRAVREGIEAQSIVPGILPIHNFQQVVRFSERCGASIPKPFYELFEGSEGNKAVQHELAKDLCLDLCERLLQEGVEAFHFYTLNIPSLTANISQELKGLAPNTDRKAA